MIVWINGANGVGKSHVAAKLAELLTDRNAEYVESDLYWGDFIGNCNNFLKAITGFTPHNNRYFLNEFKNILEEKIYNSDKMLIVSMSLVHKLCKEEVLNYFEKKKVPMFHIILEAQKETILFRIENDPIRNGDEKIEQKQNVPEQIKYLETEYPNAVKVNTENKTLDEVVGDIIVLL